MKVKMRFARDRPSGPYIVGGHKDPVARDKRFFTPERDIGGMALGVAAAQVTKTVYHEHAKHTTDQYLTSTSMAYPADAYAEIARPWHIDAPIGLGAALIGYVFIHEAFRTNSIAHRVGGAFKGAYRNIRDIVVPENPESLTTRANIALDLKNQLEKDGHLRTAKLLGKVSDMYDNAYMNRLNP